MRSMPELMLVQETIERANAHLQTVLTLVQLSFDEGAAAARKLADVEGRIIDPMASAYFGEARQLLLRPVPNLAVAQTALCLAAKREPDCFELTRAGLEALLLQAAEDTATAELMAAEQELHPEVELQNRS